MPRDAIAEMLSAVLLPSLQLRGAAQGSRAASDAHASAFTTSVEKIGSGVAEGVEDGAKSVVKGVDEVLNQFGTGEDSASGGGDKGSGSPQGGDSASDEVSGGSGSAEDKKRAAAAAAAAAATNGGSSNVSGSAGVGSADDKGCGFIENAERVEEKSGSLFCKCPADFILSPINGKNVDCYSAIVPEVSEKIIEGAAVQPKTSGAVLQGGNDVKGKFKFSEDVKSGCACMAKAEACKSVPYSIVSSNAKGDCQCDTAQKQFLAETTPQKEGTDDKCYALITNDRPQFKLKDTFGKGCSCQDANTPAVTRAKANPTAKPEAALVPKAADPAKAEAAKQQSVKVTAEARAAEEQEGKDAAATDQHDEESAESMLAEAGEKSTRMKLLANRLAMLKEEDSNSDAKLDGAEANEDAAATAQRDAAERAAVAKDKGSDHSPEFLNAMTTSQNALESREETLDRQKPILERQVVIRKRMMNTTKAIQMEYEKIQKEEEEAARNGEEEAGNDEDKDAGGATSKRSLPPPWLLALSAPLATKAVPAGATARSDGMARRRVPLGGIVFRHRRSMCAAFL